MNGNQITISVNASDFDELRKIARTRGQTVSDYVARLVSSNLATTLASTVAGTTVAGTTVAATAANNVLTEVRAATQ